MRWLNGVISGCHEGSTRTTFFVTTHQGNAILYPRIHRNHPDIKVGEYVRVNVFLVDPSLKQTCNLEVEDLIVISTPSCHVVNTSGKELKISCDVEFNKKTFQWFLFNNEYLGGILKRRGSNPDEKELTEDGKSYRVVCRKVRIEDRVPPALSSFWIIESFEKKNVIGLCMNGKPMDDKKEGEMELKNEKNVDDEVVKGEERKKQSIIPIMRKMLMDENVRRVLEYHEKATFDRIMELCTRSLTC